MSSRFDLITEPLNDSKERSTFEDILHNVRSMFPSEIPEFTTPRTGSYEPYVISDEDTAISPSFDRTSPRSEIPHTFLNPLNVEPPLGSFTGSSLFLKDEMPTPTPTLAATRTPAPRPRTTSSTSTMSTSSTDHAVSRIKKKPPKPAFEVEVDITSSPASSVGVVEPIRKKEAKKNSGKRSKRSKRSPKVHQETNQSANQSASQSITESVPIQPCDDPSSLLDHGLVDNYLLSFNNFSYFVSGFLPLPIRRPRNSSELETVQKSQWGPLYQPSLFELIASLLIPLFVRFYFLIKLIFGVFAIGFAGFTRLNILVFTIFVRFPLNFFFASFLFIFKYALSFDFFRCDSVASFLFYWSFLLLYSSNLILKKFYSGIVTKILILLFGILIRPCFLKLLSEYSLFVMVYIINSIRMKTYYRFSSLLGLLCKLVLMFFVKGFFLLYLGLLLEPFCFLPYLYTNYRARSIGIRSRFSRKRTK
ncbi:hypothetical protein P9112_011674 [Eukaryota sp. TZLM1-RC]